ncbi:hypothetical protein RVR_3447 [Actinacidiphila reveromycinica]|uniref:Uncharacterized protein n=1 Tax=Actinacidiphila reveromycinica TaxID=659352 RepID=A0A7U3URW3_9ACTN|nr:hypothetical protein [Streptomyces sp. SN-593]BBA97619.1 hypothetical protein RVR_3447 [Streptomyces sp. SN-593]
MPRPTHAQVAYGAGTVVVFTLAVLLLTGAHSTGAVVGLAALGLVLGLLVAAVPRIGGRRTPAAAPAPPGGTVPRARIGAPAQSAETRVGEHSLR